MARLRGGDKLEAYLRDVARKVSKPGKARIGFLESATYPDGTPVAQIAAIQNFGSPAQGIPPRPFFTNMIREHEGEWPEQIGKVLKAVDMDAPKALEQMGQLIAGELRESIVDTNAPPLSPITIARKGSSKPLVDSGVMLQSVDSEVEE